LRTDCVSAASVRGPKSVSDNPRRPLRTRLGVGLAGAHCVSAFRGLSAPGKRVFPRFLTKKSLGMLDACATARPSLSVIRGLRMQRLTLREIHVIATAAAIAASAPGYLLAADPPAAAAGPTAPSLAEVLTASGITATGYVAGSYYHSSGYSTFHQFDIQ